MPTPSNNDYMDAMLATTLRLQELRSTIDPKNSSEGAAFLDSLDLTVNYTVDNVEKRFKDLVKTIETEIHRCINEDMAKAAENKAINTDKPTSQQWQENISKNPGDHKLDYIRSLAITMNDIYKNYESLLDSKPLAAYVGKVYSGDAVRFATPLGVDNDISIVILLNIVDRAKIMQDYFNQGDDVTDIRNRLFNVIVDSNLSSNKEKLSEMVTLLEKEFDEYFKPTSAFLGKKSDPDQTIARLNQSMHEFLRSGSQQSSVKVDNYRRMLAITLNDIYKSCRHDVETPDRLRRERVVEHINDGSNIYKFNQINPDDLKMKDEIFVRVHH
jgi:hypothetical protein